MTLFKKSKSVLMIIMALGIWSCNESEIEESTPSPQQAVKLPEHSSKEKLKMTFSKALYHALLKNESLRTMLKEEALKMFDNDYDVLYHLVKDNILDNGKTFKELMADQLGDQKLAEIETKLPAITIFIPSLPNETFSADTWDTKRQIPQIGYNIKATNDVIMIKNEVETYVLPSYEIPIFPAIVVKESERVVIANGNGIKGISSKNQEKNIVKSADGIQFRFLDDSFNRNISKALSQPSEEEDINPKNAIDPKHRAAYDLFENHPNGWQRDHIYYDLTPANSKGPFSFDFREHITRFKLKGGSGGGSSTWFYGLNAYNKIADQTGDPRIGIQYVQGYPQTVGGWTDGFFEFKVTVLLNAKNGIGAEYVTYFPVSARDLFRVRQSTPNGTSLRLRHLRAKTVRLNLPLFKWDLDNYASTIKIEIEEVDRTEVITTTDTRTVKFATNFGLDLSIPIKKVKLGLEFGASLEETKTQTISKTYTLDNDRLGAVIIDFADDCVRKNSNNNYYVGTQYDTGWFKIDVAPLKVQ